MSEVIALSQAIDCIMNQNTRDTGSAVFPSMNWEVIQLCNKYNVGILQMPCPEIAFMGFPRTRPSGTSIRAALDTSNGRSCCRKISIDIADRIEDIIHQNAKLLAVLGGNPESPGCAVHTGDEEDRPSGVLITELRDELHKRSILVPFRGIRDFDSRLMSKDIHWLEKLFLKNNLK